MLSRRKFMALISSGLVVVGARAMDTQTSETTSANSIKALSELKQVTILNTYVAGCQYHEGVKHLHKFAIKQSVKLLAEPNNPYDQHAVALYSQNLKLGYIPKQHSKDIAHLIKSGLQLKATMTRIEEHAFNAFDIKVDLLIA